MRLDTNQLVITNPSNGYFSYLDAALKEGGPIGIFEIDPAGTKCKCNSRELLETCCNVYGGSDEVVSIPHGKNGATRHTTSQCGRCLHDLLFDRRKELFAIPMASFRCLNQNIS